VPAPNLIVLSNKSFNTALPVGYMSGGTTFNAMGPADYGLEGWPSGGFEAFPSNRGVWFKGVYFWVHGAGGTPSGGWLIAGYDPISNTRYTYVGGLAFGINNTYDSMTNSGLFVTNAANPTLFFVAGANAGLSIFHTQDGINWTQTVVIAGGGVVYFGRAIFYRNQLYVPCRNFNQDAAMAVFDPIALTGTRVLHTGSLSTWSTTSVQGSLCVFRNRIYLLRTTNTSGTLALWEFTEGTFVNRATLIATTADSATHTNGDHFLFPVGDTKMVAIAFNAVGVGGDIQANRGTRAWDLVPTGPTSFTATPKTNPLIPTALRSVADGGTAGGVALQTHRWTGYVDNDFNTTPGSPKVYIWLLDNQNGGTHTYYEYVDSDTELAPGSASLSWTYSLPYGSNGGGDRSYAAGALKALVYSVAASPVLGRMRLTARVFGDVDPGATSSGGGTNPTFGGGRHAAVVAATTTALPAVNYNNGALGVGATLTGAANGALPLQDNVSLAPTQRLLVKNQASAFQNGIYEVTQVGDGSNPFILTRAADADQVSYTPSVGITNGAWVNITSGDTLGGTAWYLRISSGNITFGTTALNWSQIPSLNRRLRIWYSTNETPNMLQATLAGTPTENYGQPPTPTRNVNALENIVADGVTLYTFDWDATADSLQSGQPLNFMARAGAT
jgi:hypothetical protein